MLSRRRFLSLSALAAAGCSGPATLPEPAPSPPRELSTDIAILGGGLGGCAAALAALNAGARVVLTEETDWIGGQLTAQLVPPDEHQYIEQSGSPLSYRRLREAIRTHYRTHTPLLPAVRQQAHLNPGNGWVSRLCHEPRVALAVLENLLQPYVTSGHLQLLRQTRPVSADCAADRVRSVTIRSVSGDETTLLAPYFLDATEQGDLLPLTQTEFVTGFESHKQTGEPHAPAEAHPGEIQSFTVCFVVEYRPGENHVIARPADYATWKEQVSALGNFGFDPTGGGNKYKTRDGKSNLWTYRRILDHEQFTPGAYPGDLSVINWAQNDYHHGSLHGVSEEEAARHLARGKSLSLSLLYWLQTEAPRSDGRTGWQELKLRPDATGSKDGLAKTPYIRESRRLQAEFTVLEQHVGRKLREATARGGPVRAEPYADSVGVGLYLYMDLHRCVGGSSVRPGFDGAICPFQIPLGALLPRRVENLLAACKNLGVTHLTNGCFRLHPVEWNVGEAAGSLAAFCLERKEPPRRVRKDPRLLADFQKRLREAGVELEWSRDIVK